MHIPELGPVSGRYAKAGQGVGELSNNQICFITQNGMNIIVPFQQKRNSRNVEARAN